MKTYARDHGLPREQEFGTDGLPRGSLLLSPAKTQLESHSPPSEMAGIQTDEGKQASYSHMSLELEAAPMICQGLFSTLL